MFRRRQRAVCAFCTDEFAPGEKFCPSCEQPTRWATHSERVQWEVDQWQRARTSASSIERGEDVVIDLGKERFRHAYGADALNEAKNILAETRAMLGEHAAAE